MWSDNETSLDLLGFGVHSDLIRGLVLRQKLLPLTVGIFGDWGSGKTSIMKMLQESLDHEKATDPEEKKRLEKVAVLYFNGWMFEGYDDAKAALISSVLKELIEHQRFGPKVRRKATALLQTVDWMRVAKIGVKDMAVPLLSAYLSGGATIPGFLGGIAKRVIKSEDKQEAATDDEEDELEEDEDAEEDKDAEKDGEDKDEKDKDDKDDWGKVIKKPTPATPPDIRKFREDFASLLKDSKIDALVVLIDDLDRCSPSRILDNLEAIKLFLNVENTAFVIGADPRIVRHAILTRYPPAEFQREEGAVGTAETLVTDYLEKLIQVPYRLPRLSPAEVETYMALLFCNRDLTDEADSLKVLEACNLQRAANRYSVFGYSAIEKALSPNPCPDELASSLTFCAAAAPLITEGLKGNPRQVKRFLNAFTLRKELAGVAHLENIRDDVLVKLMILEYGPHQKHFFDLFASQQQHNGFPEEIRKLEAAISDSGEISEEEAKRLHEPWSNTFMRRWTAMEPRLADVDLRDYFWIARDRLESSLAGSSLLSPPVRRVLEDLLGNDIKRLRGARAAGDLDADDKIVLLSNLGQTLLRRQTEGNLYNAFRVLIEGNVAGAASAFSETLLKCAPQSVPANVGLDLITLSVTSDELKRTFAPVIERWAKTESGVGRAVARTLNPQPTEQSRQQNGGR